MNRFTNAASGSLASGLTRIQGRRAGRSRLARVVVRLAARPQLVDGHLALVHELHLGLQRRVPAPALVDRPDEV